METSKTNVSQDLEIEWAERFLIFSCKSKNLLIDSPLVQFFSKNKQKCHNAGLK